MKTEEEKNRLKRLVQSIRPKGFGVIVRTVAKDKKVAELDADLQQLVQRWKNMCASLPKINKYPTKVLSEIDRSSSILRDIFDDSFTGIHVDDKELYGEISEYLKPLLLKS